MSSNCCEQCFGILVKYTQGKRIILDKTDTWRVLQYFVAGLSCNADFISDIFENLGVLTSPLRITKMNVTYAKKRLSTEVFQERRIWCFVER